MKLKKKPSVLRRKKPNLDRSLRPELTFYTQPLIPILEFNQGTQISINPLIPILEFNLQLKSQLI